MEKKDKEYFERLLSSICVYKKRDILEKLSKLRKYSFCKAHSYSYAQLVYKIAYQKAHNPKKFWISTLKNIKSSYRKWVHIFEAKSAGINVMKFLNKKTDKSVYAVNRRKKFNDLSVDEQIKKDLDIGIWISIIYLINAIFIKERYLFYNGIIASLRIIGFNKKKQIICSLCVE